MLFLYIFLASSNQFVNNREVLIGGIIFIVLLLLCVMIVLWGILQKQKSMLGSVEAELQVAKTVSTNNDSAKIPKSNSNANIVIPDLQETNKFADKSTNGQNTSDSDDVSVDEGEGIENGTITTRNDDVQSEGKL